MITDERFSFVQGYPNGTFQPEGFITRAEIVAILFRLVDDDSKHLPVAGRFTDVIGGWYTQYVNYLAIAGVIAGFPDGTFRPNDLMTRAELTKLMSLFFSISEGGSNFTDIQGHWAYRYIVSASNSGWITGYEDGTFRPDMAITRAEAVTIINRAIDRRPDPASVDELIEHPIFPDVPRNHWAYYQIKAAAIKHEYMIDENGIEIWLHIYLPSPRLPHGISVKSLSPKRYIK